MISEGESVMRDGDFMIADAVNRKLTDHIFKVKSSPVPSDIVPLLRLYFLLVPSLHKEHHYLGASVQILSHMVDVSFKPPYFLISFQIFSVSNYPSLIFFLPFSKASYFFAFHEVTEISQI